MRRFLHITLALALLFALTLVPGCGGGGSSEPTEPTSSAEPTTPVEPTSSVEPTAPPEPKVETKSLILYFTRGEKVGAAGRTMVLPVETETVALAELAMQQLLEGPTPEETEFGLLTQIPEGTVLNSVEVTAGVAIVDLSPTFESGGGSLSMLLRVAQVVHTLTQFSDIQGVSFELDGQPVTAIGGEGVLVDPPVSRVDFEAQAPAILVESPVPDDHLTNPFTISGTANTFEAQFKVEVVDPEGIIVATQSVMATSGTGTRGLFKTTIAFEPTRSGLGAIIVSEPSAKDGSPTNVVEIPVWMTK